MEEHTISLIAILAVLTLLVRNLADVLGKLKSILGDPWGRVLLLVILGFTAYFVYQYTTTMTHQQLVPSNFVIR